MSFRLVDFLVAMVVFAIYLANDTASRQAEIKILQHRLQKRETLQERISFNQSWLEKYCTAYQLTSRENYLKCQQEIHGEVLQKQYLF